MFRWLRALTGSNIGQKGERLAASFLKKHGYKIVERNWHSPVGEVDIIAIDKDCLVFVEVKTRGGEQFGTPLEAVGPPKQRKIFNSARCYTRINRCDDVPVRFDVVSVCYRGRKFSLELTRNAFEGI